MKNAPSVSVPARIWRVPMNIIIAPTTPMQHAGRKAHHEVAVRVFRHCPAAASRRRKILFFALFGVISLDYAHAAQRFGQPAGDFGIDLARARERLGESC